MCSLKVDSKYFPKKKKEKQWQNGREQYKNLPEHEK